MLTEQRMFLDVLGSRNTQYTIPVFQRVYSWSKDQCDELWGDILRAGRTSNTHFMGTLLYSVDSDDSDGVTRLSVIDGQQRTATLTLLLAAFERHLRKTGTVIGHIDADFVRDNLLFVGDEHKLVLSRTDRKTLFAILDDAPMPELVSERIVDNFAFFCEKTEEDGFRAEDLWAGLQQLLLISANLTGEDNPQLIFESLNSRGTPLTVGDLVRNYLLIAEDRKDQERLYEEYWKPIEMMFGDDPGSERLNAGIRMWLTIRFVKERVRDKSHTYSVFKAYIEDEYEGTFEDLLIELRDFCLMWSENYKDHNIMTGSKEFRSWKWAKDKPTTLVPPRASQGGF